MDTSIGLVNSRPFEDDLDYLEDDDDDDEQDIQRIDTKEKFSDVDVEGEGPNGVNVKKVLVREEQYKSMDDVVKGIKKILINAKYNDVPLDFEEFDFDSLYQIIVKVKKEEDK
jgi:hypothetical protein